MKRSKKVDFPKQGLNSMRCLEQHQPLSETIPEPSPPRTFGDLKYLVLEVGDSFDTELEDFAGYAPALIACLKVTDSE
jgi:hypothetical protein